MGRGRLVAAAALCVAGSGCGGGNTSGASGGSAVSLTGTLELLDHSPASDAMQVPLQTPIELRFDAAVVADCLADPETGLLTATNGERVPGTFEAVDGGRTIQFHPRGGLAPETDYEFRVSPLTCDTSGRILDRDVRFAFRSLDATPPAVSSASVQPSTTGVSRSAPILITFSESLDPASVDSDSLYLRDVYGNAHPVDLFTSGPDVQVTPAADLAGGRSYVLVAAGGDTGVRDRAGNPLTNDWTVSFTAAEDNLEPSGLSVWPLSGPSVSPRVHPTVTFDESMDRFSVEPISVLFMDEFGSLVPFRVHASRDQRTLRVEPLVMLVPGRDYTMAFRAGSGSVKDVSGNDLAGPVFVFFTVGTDGNAPVLVSARPSNGASGVPVSSRVELRFDEPLDTARIGIETVELLGPDGPEPVVVEAVQPDLIRLTPSTDLDPDTAYRVVVRGGHEGVRDLAGNPLYADAEITFRTNGDVTLPIVMVQPRNGAGGVPIGARFSAVFDSPLDPASVGAANVQMWDLSGRQVFGAIALEQGGRVVSFRPGGGWQAGRSYRAVLRGGPEGLRETSGNWLRNDLESSFSVGFESDATPPTVEVVLNGTDSSRSENLVLPPFGFTVDVRADDPRYLSTDYGTVTLRFTGPGRVPSPVDVFAVSRVDTTGLHYVVPSGHALEPGEYTLVAEVSDLSGNVGVSAPTVFRVSHADANLLPFERTQVVWVRTDLDRDGNGTGDFEDDMLRLGFATPGDPIGTNEFVEDVLRRGILARANELLNRDENGDVLDEDSVPVRLTDRRPLGLAHMQMALGGPDPAGRRGRVFGEPSTGILGRALFDYRNRQVNELNISTAPALGVFPAEMFFFQAELHVQVYPGFLTLFGQRFINICPAMGGVPAGSHAEDPVVLSPTFDYTNATSRQRARFHQVFDAADDWASVIGVVLAHEIGHSVGLVAPGPSPQGLHGNSSLHNEFSTAAEVMASAVGYESMVTLDYRFRDLNLAYLRQRVLLK